MGSISGEDTFEWDSLTPTSARDDKISVSVRLRPLNERELSNSDVSDWECINDTTIIFKNTFHERSLFPSAHTFDRVFGPESPTRQVYEEAAKSIALSVLSGINSTIFAYGQTSSGKTYTMTGITEYAMADIYEYIEKHHDREFVLKFSALEIYNESVKDLLSADDTALRLLDDPEKGTIVENLKEVTLRDSSHLKQLLSICESHRQVGETTLNEMSSRSHQILRLTIESEAREYLGAETSSILTASVNFVDLAGSERVSQTLSANTKLKEGCHINRSLLTLGTVIRKLSKGRNGHIPFRDSKLTRILQNSLGGNAKTAVICTMSPAHAHIEQSRNTLSFASCAKKISTNAQVNVVMSEKAVVKQLQRELARLENELRNLSTHGASSDSTSALKEKELVIEKMVNEIKELKDQRDLAQSRLEIYLRSEGEYLASKSLVGMKNHEKGSWTDEYSPTSLTENQFSEKNDEFLSEDTSPTLYIDKYFGPDPCQGWEKIVQETDNNFEDNSKEVQCVEIDFTKVSGEFFPPKGDHHSGRSSSSSEPSRTSVNLSIKDSQSSIGSEFMNVKEQNNTVVIEDCMSNQQDPCFKEDNVLIKPETVKQSAEDLEDEDTKTSNDPEKVADDGSSKTPDTKQCASYWSTEFERQKREIIELWDICNIPLVHRTYFFLLFNGDPSDAIYMEVELRRLSFLKNTLHGVTVVKDDPFFTRASSAKALNRERHMLSKMMVKKFSRKEREALYKKWGIDLKSKHRRLKFCRRLWTDVTNMEHVKESAAIIARLVGFKERGQAPKEMFALSLSMKPEKIKPFHWKHGLPSIVS